MHDAPPHLLRIEPLGAEAFRRYGDVIEAGSGAAPRHINQGSALRFDGLAAVDAAADGGRPVISIFRAQPQALPLRLWLVERHCLGSQAFMPLGPRPYLVVVAAAGEPPAPDQLRCFLAAPGQGVNYARGTWHHPLLALRGESDFLVVDRAAAAAPDDCEEHLLQATPVWIPA